MHLAFTTDHWTMATDQLYEFALWIDEEKTSVMVPAGNYTEAEELLKEKLRNLVF